MMSDQKPLSEMIGKTKGGVIGKPLLDMWAAFALELEENLEAYKEALETVEGPDAENALRSARARLLGEELSQNANRTDG